MFSKVLIANRGEIAGRVIRACRELGIRTVEVHSEADAGAPHALAADERVPIGPPPARQSYLDAARILAAAKETGAEAIHPGYGFLSENAGFARQCREAGIVFIGPRAEAIEKMGEKATARALMQAAGFAPRAKLPANLVPNVLLHRGQPKRLWEHRCPVCHASRVARRRVPRWRCAACRATGLEGSLTVTEMHGPARRQT